MISTRKYLQFQLFSSIKSLPEYQGIKLIYKGNADHFSFIKQNSQHLRNQKLYLFQREPIDICFEMLKQNTRTITYITSQNYQTVTAIPNEINEGQKETKYVNQWSSNLTKFMSQNKLYIKKSFLDLHPKQSYHKLCSFLNTKKDSQILKIFKFCSFTKHQLSSDAYVLPFLKEIRETYLVIQELKLRKLSRKRDATSQQINSAIGYWKKTYQIPDVYPSQPEEQNFKSKYAVESSIGEYVKVQDLLEGYGQKSCYAAWVNQTQ